MIKVLTQPLHLLTSRRVVGVEPLREMPSDEIAIGVSLPE
jgi:hypothetical protein